MGYREHQKELKAPDEFQKVGQQAVPWLEQHAKSIATITGVGLLIFGGVSLANHMYRKSGEKAARGFGASLKVLARDVNPNPPATLEPGEEPPFKTEQERDDALIKELTDFRVKNVGTKAATASALPLAQALLRRGRAEEALPLVDEYLGKGDPADPLRPAALEARGYAYESQKKYDQALSAFDQLSKETKGEYLKGMGLYHHARVQALKGDKQAAANEFAKVVSEDKDTAAARLAKDRLALLSSEGIFAAASAIPAPAPAVDAGS